MCKKTVVTYPHIIIEFLIHCYCRPEPIENIDSGAIKEAIIKLLKDDIIVPTEDENIYFVTEKGAVWLKKICSTPYPTWGYNEL